jgi:hypothetical protein
VQPDGGAISVDGTGVALHVIGGAVDALASVAAITAPIVIPAIARRTASPFIPDTRHIAIAVAAAVAVVDQGFVGEVSRPPLVVTRIRVT